MGKLHDTYRLKITTLSPLHIGTGKALQREFDYVTHNRRTWVVNENMLAEGLLDNAPEEFQKMLEGARASELIREEDYDEASPLFRYVMKGMPRSDQRGAELQELIKDIYDRPYIPGSSLKGALRTALAFVGWNQLDLKFNMREHLGKSRKYAAAPMEQKVLVGEKVQRNRVPNYDLLRMLQLSDTSPKDERQMEVENAQVVHPNGDTDTPIELEVVPGDVTFTANLSIDGYLLRDENAHSALGITKQQRSWIRKLARAINMFSEVRIGEEISRWSSQKAVRSFYRNLYNQIEGLGDDAFLIQVGWGGGWDSKTFGTSVLRQDEKQFARLINQYKILRQGEIEPGERFPKTRRVMMREGTPVVPFGWLKVEMEPL